MCDSLMKHYQYIIMFPFSTSLFKVVSFSVCSAHHNAYNSTTSQVSIMIPNIHQMI